MDDFDVKVITDSISPAGRRLTTITATYPRFIHSEIMTHRDRARNAASSRAIPFPAMTERIERAPVVPIKWGMEQSGMQTGGQIPEPLIPLARAIWLKARDAAVEYARMLHQIEDTALNHERVAIFDLTESEIQHLRDWIRSRSVTDQDIKIHKSIPNRIVEPWMWITVVMTATEWKNFFRLRCHADAEVHFQKIACMIRDALAASKPQFREAGQWHLPFTVPEDFTQPLEHVKRASVARCARVSYLNHDGVPDFIKDLGLFDRLVAGSGFGHWSAHEHVAESSADGNLRSGPFNGWKQFPKSFEGENIVG